VVVQKKRKKVKPPINPKVFNWTPQRRKAALLLSEGTKTYEDVAAEVGIHYTTLWDWRKHPLFLSEVDRLTLENEKATRAGLVRLALKALKDKETGIKEDKNTALDWAKFIADIQGHVKQKVELDANLKHEIDDPEKMTDEELQQAIKDELRKINADKYLSDIEKN
jgi:hypothetical protein